MTDPIPAGAPAGYAALRPLDPVAVMHVAANMRVPDALEIYATRWPLGGSRTGPDNPAQLAADVVACSRFGAVAWWGEQGRERPVAALGAAELWPHVWSVWMFATPAWPRVARATTRWCRSVLKPSLLGAGGVRAQCYVIAWYAPAQRWLEHLGFRVETELPLWGRNGETFLLMSWIRGRSPDVQPFGSVRRRGLVPPGAARTAGGPAPGADQDAAGSS